MTALTVYCLSIPSLYEIWRVWVCGTANARVLRPSAVDTASTFAWWISWTSEIDVL